MFWNLLVLVTLACAPPVCGAQAAAGAGSAQSSPDTSTAVTAVSKPTELLAPAIGQLGRAVSQTHLERWKGSARDETDANLRSIERDLQSTLPPLLQAADDVPNSISASLPVLRNLNALIAVMLRITTAAWVTAPQNEAQALNNSLEVLEGARLSLEDQVQQLATSQEKQIADLQSRVKSQAASLAASQAAPQTSSPANSTTSAKSKRSRK